MASVDRSALERVTAVANGKGGVFKTTLSANLAALATMTGARGLLVDLDPQGDVGDDLGYNIDGRGDNGRHLLAALQNGDPLQPVLTDVRPGLDVICGGEALDDLSAVLMARRQRGRSVSTLLAEALSPLAAQYDLIVIDTPPRDEQLQTLALVAARWVICPTRVDTSSIRALATLADRVWVAREDNADLELLGVALVEVPANATRIRRDAADDIETILGGVAPLFDQSIRSSQGVAREARKSGLLAHELAEKVDGAEPYWKALREGRTPERLPGSAPALADDYVKLVDQILTRIGQVEDAQADTKAGVA